MKAQVKVLTDQDEKFQRECTFKPQIKEIGTVSRYKQLTEELIRNNINAKDIFTQQIEPSRKQKEEEENCTFKP